MNTADELRKQKVRERAAVTARERLNKQPRHAGHTGLPVSGARGVTWSSSAKKWKVGVVIRPNEGTKPFGYFDDLEDAVIQRDAVHTALNESQFLSNTFRHTPFGDALKNQEVRDELMKYGVVPFHRNWIGLPRRNPPAPQAREGYTPMGFDK